MSRVHCFGNPSARYQICAFSNGVTVFFISFYFILYALIFIKKRHSFNPKINFTDSPLIWAEVTVPLNTYTVNTAFFSTIPLKQLSILHSGEGQQTGAFVLILVLHKLRLKGMQGKTMVSKFVGFYARNKCIWTNRDTVWRPQVISVQD